MFDIIKKGGIVGVVGLNLNHSYFKDNNYLEGQA